MRTSIGQCGRFAIGIMRRVQVLTYSFITLPALLIGTNRVATVHERVARRLVGVWPLEIRPTPIKIDPMEQAMQPKPEAASLT